MNMKQLKYVLVLAEEGSFSRAAAELNISQPSLSQYIRKIENEIGLELFDRTNGDVRITDAGRIYMDAGKKILDLEHQMEVKFSDIAENKSGSLTIGATPYRTSVMMPAVAAEFKKKYPGMVLNFVEVGTSLLSEKTEHGEFDLCVTMAPVDSKLFYCESVMQESIILAVPSSFPPIECKKKAGEKYPVISVKSVASQPFIMLSDTQYMQKRLDELLSENQISVTKAIEVKSLESQISMVRAGIGMALVASGIEKFCATGEVRFYCFEEELPKREVVLIRRKDRRLSRAGEELRNIILGMEW